jgi:hypothetical protein
MMSSSSADALSDDGQTRRRRIPQPSRPLHSQRIPSLDSVLKRENLSPAGQFVEVTVPDTLDLAARAALLLNALTRNSDAKNHHSVYESLDFGQKPR